MLVDDGATALLVANNLMAIGALQTIRDRSLRIPEDVAVMSIDDPPWAELTDPPLTTLAQPAPQMAEAAVGLLLERIDEGRTRRKTRVFELELRHRGAAGRKCEMAQDAVQAAPNAVQMVGIRRHFLGVQALKGVEVTVRQGVIGVVHALLERGLVGKVKVVGFDNAPDEVSALGQGQCRTRWTPGRSWRPRRYEPAGDPQAAGPAGDRMTPPSWGCD